jgi:hypothetical protein
MSLSHSPRRGHRQVQPQCVRAIAPNESWYTDN